MSSIHNVNRLSCTKDTIASLKETNITEYDNFEDSLNSTLDSLDGHQNISSYKIYKDLPGETLTKSIGEQSFNDICDEFSIFLNEEENCESFPNKNKILKNENEPLKIDDVNQSDEIKLKTQSFKKDDTSTKIKETEKNTKNMNYKFQDIDSEFFETDCETNEVEETEKVIRTNFKFHDISSECLETDNESTNNERKYFQDVESDFFDDEDLLSPRKIHSTPKTKTKKEKTSVNAKTPDESKNDKTIALSNSLLRSTINELERALNDSNILLAKRDLKIQELRQQNTELQKNFEEQHESASQLQLLLLDKDTASKEIETKYHNLKQHLELLNKEINELRLYKMNNLPNQENSQGSSDDNSEKDTIIINKNTASTCQKNNTIENNPSIRKNLSDSCLVSNKKCRINGIQAQSPIESDFKPISGQCKKKCFRNKQQNNSSIKYENEDMTPVENSRKLSDDKLSQSELHAHLRMKFMRDAFFYYMIGFHPDEQMNAILAILDYGDKRQDFVLEAHKMKKVGKKISVTKVSSRGLSFIQEIKDLKQ